MFVILFLNFAISTCDIANTDLSNRVPPYCTSCDSTPDCDDCTNGYVLVNKACQSCSEKVDGNCLSCTYTPTDGENSEKYTCVKCKPNFKPDDEGRCAEITDCNTQISYCASCSYTPAEGQTAEKYTCVQCEPNYKQDSNGNCVPFTDCGDQISNCVSCLYTPAEGQTDEKYTCIECNDKSILSHENTCLSCEGTSAPACCNIEQCYQCGEQTSTCTKCSPPYRWDGTECKFVCGLQIDNCLDCSEANTGADTQSEGEEKQYVCNECSVGYKPKDDKSQCEEITSAACSEEIENCLLCSYKPATAENVKEYYCYQCESNFAPNADKTTCVAITDCSTRIESCEICSYIAEYEGNQAETTCTQCIPNFKPSKDGKHCNSIDDCGNRITNCESCSVKSDDSYECVKCNRGYKLNNKQCIELDDPNPSDKTYCDETVQTVGCSSCSTTNRKQCTECNGNLHFDTTVTTEGCECANGYQLNAATKTCELFKGECDSASPIVGCLNCNKDKTQCVLCDTSKGFIADPEQGACKCSNPLAVPDSGSCVFTSGCDAENPITGCLACNSGGATCKVCDASKSFNPTPNGQGKCDCLFSGFTPNEQGICSRPTNNCNPSINGCLICDEAGTKCTTCDESLNFQKTANSDGLCVDCKTGFSLRDDGQCLLDILPITPDFSVDESKVKFLSTTFATQLYKGEVVEVNTKTGSQLNDPNAFYSVDLNSNIKEIKFENSLDNFGIILDKDDLLIDPKTDADKCQVHAGSVSTPTILLPTTCGNVNLWEFTQLTIAPKEGTKGDITINKITGTSNLKIKPESSNVVFKTIDVYGTTPNVEGDSTGAGKLSANNINVQQGSKAVLKNLKVNQVLTLSPGSTVKFDGVDFSKSTINIKNSEPEDPSKPLITFENPNDIKKQPAKISIHKSELNSKLLAEDKITIVSGAKDVFDDATCKAWAATIKEGDYNKNDCVETDDGNRKLTVKREEEPPSESTTNSEDENDNPTKKKKDGLSAGAIAGIVIACVVVVAAIIALLVYFLVIKKKKDATSSTQGDSSIAI